VRSTSQVRQRHLNAAGWLQWLALYQPRAAKWYSAHVHPEFTGIKNTSYYLNVLRDLRDYVEPEVFERVVGVRFSRQLIEGVA
jgi:hypothetical protein